MRMCTQLPNRSKAGSIRRGEAGWSWPRGPAPLHPLAGYNQQLGAAWHPAHARALALEAAGILRIEGEGPQSWKVRRCSRIELRTHKRNDAAEHAVLGMRDLPGNWQFPISFGHWQSQ